METVAEVQRECTAEEGTLWRERFSEGYRVGRGDRFWNQSPRIDLVRVPPELPGETGARYVARYVGIAWAIGYTRAYLHYSAR